VHVGEDLRERQQRIVELKADVAVFDEAAFSTQPGQPFVKGNNFWINIDCDDNAEQDRLFKGLSEGGKVLMELADQFWGARFGMLTDKFGTNWMFNCEKQK